MKVRERIVLRTPEAGRMVLAADFCDVAVPANKSLVRLRTRRGCPPALLSIEEAIKRKGNAAFDESNRGVSLFKITSVG